jgi:hypothetical protein
LNKRVAPNSFGKVPFPLYEKGTKTIIIFSKKRFFLRENRKTTSTFTLEQTIQGTGKMNRLFRLCRRNKMNRFLSTLWVIPITVFLSPFLLLADEQEKEKKEEGALLQPVQVTEMTDTMPEMKGDTLAPMELPTCGIESHSSPALTCSTASCSPPTCPSVDCGGTSLAPTRRLACRPTCNHGLFDAIWQGKLIDDCNHLYTEILEYDSSQACCYRGKNTFRGGTLILERSNPGSIPLVGNAAGDVIRLNANEFDFNYRGGYDFSFTRHRILHHPCWDVEGRYFRIDDFNAQVPATGTGGVAVGSNEDLIQFSAPLGIGGATGTVHSSYFSHLDGIELNAKRKLFCGSVNFIVGARFIELDERGSIFSNIGTDTGYMQSRAINDMYGIQIGGEGILLTWRRFSIEGFIKAGVYNNEIVTHLSYEDTTGVSGELAGTATQTSFLGETGLSFVFQFTSRLAARGGYQCLWMEGVATPWQQISGSNMGTGVTSINADGSPFYHGVLVTLDYQW